MLDHPLDPADARRREALAITRARIAGLAKLRSDLAGDPVAVEALTERLRDARRVERLLARRSGAAANACVTRRTWRIAVSGGAR